MTEPRKIGPESIELIASAQEVLVSSISILELTIKQMKAKLPSIDFVAGAAAAGIKILEFSAQDALGIRSFPQFVGHDPFDRALMSQAKTNNLVLLTSDREILAIGEAWAKNIGA
jgi:PIN domain nuclease of toxin-antitoxin system